MSKRIGLLLSSGGSRGLAHIGVLKVLDQNKIKVSIIAGTSMGAIIGALYASGCSAEEIQKKVITLKLIKLIGLIDPSFGKGGLIKGEKVVQYLESLIPVKRFEDLKMPLVINATDLTKQEEVIFNKGNLLEAIRASISIPGIFIPEFKGEQILVDGGVINPIAMNLFDDSEADVLIVVDLVSRLKFSDNKKLNALQVLQSAFLTLEQEIVKLSLKQCKKEVVIIRPDIDRYDMFNIAAPLEIVKKGELAAQEKLQEILKKSSTFFERVFK